MASGPTCRAKRPNTWLHRPMLHTFKKVLANSEPSTRFCLLSRSPSGIKQTPLVALHMSAFDPKRTLRQFGPFGVFLKPPTMSRTKGGGASRGALGDWMLVFPIRGHAHVF